MSSKSKKKKTKISFVGTNADDVTGSMALLEFNDKKVLLEAGLFQNNNLERDYLINKRTFKSFKPKDINYIFLGHIHADHSLLIPRLFKEGCRAKIIIPHGCKEILKVMAEDSVYIMGRDAAALSKKKGKSVEAIYKKEHVDLMMENILEFSFNSENQLSDDLSFKFISSGHIISSAQIILKIKNGNKTEKILYTSDLGNISLPKPYALPFSSSKEYFDIVIGECTYGDRDKHISKKYKEKDLEKLKTIIDETIKTNGRVLIPTFSLDRTQQIATELYLLYHEDKDFKTKIVIDSPLACKISELYLQLLPESQQKLWQDVYRWDNLKLVNSFKLSEDLRNSGESLVVLASPGFITKGRSLEWTKAFVQNENDYIVTCGYFPENSLLAKIKDRKTKEIKIDNKKYKNNAKIYSLLSFSSHAQQKDLLNYYSKLNTKNLVLVHGSTSAKEELKRKLDEILLKENNQMKVVTANRNLTITL